MTKQEFLANVLYHCLDYGTTRKFPIPESVFSLSLIDDVYDYLIDHGVGDYNVYFEGRNFLVLRHNSDDQA